MSFSNLSFSPDKVLKQIFQSINQIRVQYGRTPLQFDQDLSFLAGEHAVRMSTNTVPFGHDGFNDRQLSTPMAISYSENIAMIDPHDNPANQIIMSWLARPSAFSRILASFTHTGIGVAEDENGNKYYCCQILVSKKTRLTRKEQLLLVGRYINRIRIRKKLKPLAYSLVATARIFDMAKQLPESLLGITTTRVKLMFPSCIEAEYLTEKFSYSTDNLEQFLKMIYEHSNSNRMVRKDFTDMAFIMKYINQENVVCTLLLAKCKSAYRKVPVKDLHYSMGSQCLQLVNDYRLAHKLSPLIFSHQYCRFANKYVVKMMNKEIELDDSKITRLLKRRIPNSKTKVGAYKIPMSFDPLREFFLIWISDYHTRAKLLGDFTHFGFGMAVIEDSLCYAIRILVKMPKEENADANDVPAATYDEENTQYASLTSDESIFEENPKNTEETFRLTP